MILAEKLSQKLHNLKSKGEIKDFFIFFDEYRRFEINLKEGEISSLESPNHFCENSEGNFVIVWEDGLISKGKINSESVNSFEEFLGHTKSTKIIHPSSVYIPERGIYPMVITYSKTLADMIDIPEYLLKIADVTAELDKMVKAGGGSSKITVREGVRYAFSSRNLDEYYPYTHFNLTKTISDKLHWSLQTSEIFPMIRFEELFRFLGDTYNFVRTSKVLKKDLDKDTPVILSPNIFHEILFTHIIDNLKAENILQNNTPFTPGDFDNRAKVLGSLSLSYDPLINHKPGTYKFTHYGLKPEKQYFIKFGKLTSIISNNFNYSDVGHIIPTIDISHISNIKFEGIKKRSFEEIKRSKENFLFCFNEISNKKIGNSKSLVYVKNPLLFQNNKSTLLDNYSIEVDLINRIAENAVELVEFPDGQIGCRINPI